jgi:ethanolamine utilization protein EutQ (cupin superfamily)
MSGKIIKVGDIKTKKLDAITDADIFIGLAEPANESTVPMSVGVFKQIGAAEVIYIWDEVGIVTEGPIEAIFDGEKHICNVGDIMLVKKGTKVTLQATSGDACALVFVTLPHLEEALKGTPLEGAL